MSLDTFPTSPSQPQLPEHTEDAQREKVFAELKKLPESGFNAFEKIFSLSPSLENLQESIKNFNALPDSDRKIPYDTDRTLEERNNAELSVNITIPGGYPVSILISKDGVASLSSDLD